MTSMPASRAVRAVIGPMQATTGGNKEAPSSSNQPVTVEDDENITARQSATARIEILAHGGTHRPVRLDDVDLVALLPQCDGEDVPRHRGAGQQDPLARSPGRREGVGQCLRHKAVRDQVGLYAPLGEGPGGAIADGRHPCRAERPGISAPREGPCARSWPT